MLPTPPDKSPPCYRWRNGTECCRRASQVLLREFFLLTIRTKKLPDSSEPWASEICQANPVSFTPRNCVQQFHFNFGNRQPDECVLPAIFSLKAAPVGLSH